MKKYTLTNDKGVEIGILDFGGIITNILVPDRDGLMGDVVLGFEDLEEYRTEHPYFGAIIGRFGNRIAKGKFELDGKTYQLVINSDPNNLHGGPIGFNKVIWKVEDSNTSLLRLRYLSPDGDQGFPGNLQCFVTYSLNNSNELKIDYEAFTDRITVINLTNHSYFNLNNAGGHYILDHEMELQASYYTPLNKDVIPTGDILPVKNTPFDFTSMKSIGKDAERIGGYDHNMVLDKAPGEMVLFARVISPDSGRMMEVLTTEPGVQFFTPESLNIMGKNGQFYGKWPGFCLETQHYPDSPNQPEFPSVVLRPGETYYSTTIYRFKVMAGN